MKSPAVALLALSLLSACGAGGGVVPTPTTPPAPTLSDAPREAKAVAQPRCQPSPYYPECDGTHHFYTSRQITAAHFDDANHVLIVDATSDAPNKLGAILTFQYFTSTCGEKSYQGESWSFHDWNGFAADWAEAKANQMNDGVFTSANGIEYIGEAGGGTLGAQLDLGEPEITLNPREGEYIHTNYNRNAGCGKPFKPFPEFTTDYWTGPYFEVWTSPNGIQYHKVRQTTLIENSWNAEHTALTGQTFYLYEFALGIGQVYGATWHVAYDDSPEGFNTVQNYISYGIEYEVEP